MLLLRSHADEVGSRFLVDFSAFRRTFGAPLLHRRKVVTMRLSTASVFVVHLLVLVLCSEARLGGFDPLGVSITDVKLPVPFQRRILDEQVISTTTEAEVAEVKEINGEPKPEDKNEAVQQQEKEEATPAKNDVEKSEEKGKPAEDQGKPAEDQGKPAEDQGKPAEDSKEEKEEEQLKPVEVVKEEKNDEQLKRADEVKEENKEEQSKPADDVKEEKKEDQWKPGEKENEKEEQKPLEESKEEKVENVDPKAGQEDNHGKSLDEQKPLEERKEEGKNVEQEKEDIKADVEAAAKAEKKEEERKIKEKEKQLKAEQKEAAKLKEKMEKAKAKEIKEAAKAKEKDEVKKKEEKKELKDEGEAAAGHAQIVESMETAKGKTAEEEHKEEGGEKIEMATWEVKDSSDTEKKFSESTPKLEENLSQRTEEGDKSIEETKNEAMHATTKAQDSSKQSGPKESEDGSIPEVRVAVTDADEDYPDFLEELRNFPERFQKTAESVKDHIRYSGLDLNRYSTHSKELFNQANHQIQESFTPLLGKDYAPAIAYVVSYGLLLLPLALVMYLLDRVRAIFSLQKVLFFINIYLSAYFAALLAATFILDSEPMAFFMKYSSSSYVFLQLLQAFGYLAYLLLNTIDLLSTCSGGRFAAKFSATVQFFVVVAVGFHYYVTVFHRAMERKAPITGWKIYGLYSASFFFLCLFARIERGKKQYPPVEQDDETDKKN